MENRNIRRNEHKIFIIVFNDDKMVKNALTNVSNYSRTDYQQKTLAIFNGLAIRLCTHRWAYYEKIKMKCRKIIKQL